MLSFLFAHRSIRAFPLLPSFLAGLLLNVLLSTHWCPQACAAGVVSVPTEAALNAAMQGGGLVTFTCDGVIPITRTKYVGPGTAGDGTTTLTLDATGHNITLDGGGKVQLFFVDPFQEPSGAYTPYALTLKHLTLANGLAGGGGAISAASGTTLNVDACTFANNKASVWGGAILVFGSFPIGITITNSVFVGNQVDATGAPGSVWSRLGRSRVHHYKQ